MPRLLRSAAMEGPTPGIVCSSSVIRMNAHTIALAVDEVSIESHSRGQRGLGQDHLATRLRHPRERPVESALRLQVDDAAAAAGLVALALDDAARHRRLLGGKDAELRAAHLVAAKARLEDLLVEADCALEIRGGNLEPHGDVVRGGGSAHHDLQW